MLRDNLKLLLFLVVLLFCLTFLGSIFKIYKANLGPLNPLRMQNIPLVSAVTPTPTPTLANNPIILVHGVCLVFTNKQCEDSMNSLRDFLIQKGYKAYIAPLPGNDNEKNAQYLAAFVDQTLSSEGKSKANLIVHSMGLFSGLYYIKFLGGGSKVSSLIALDTGREPNDLFCKSTVENGSQLCSSSTFRTQLFNSKDNLAGVSYVQIRALWTMFGWSNNRISADRLTGGVWWSTVFDNHLDILKDTSVFQKIVDTLNGKPPGEFYNN